MPAPRPSQNAEAARAAAAQAEFNEKKWVWVPDDKDGYLAGWVVKEEDDFGDVVMAAGGDMRRLPLYALSKMNPPKFDRVEDIADLTFLNEASVVHNLRLRYGANAIYTYSGLFLVAINPYQPLPLYSDSIVAQYRGRRRDENPPHIFAIAERAWVSMGAERENQSILITGESGAGKTESTKKVIQYLAAIATDTHAPEPPVGGGSRIGHGHSQSVSSHATGSVMPAAGLPRNPSFRSHKPTQSVAPTGGGSGFASGSSKARLGLLERQILQANPLLEAFGNAQTQRNNNSSRFGKFVRISFAPDGSIAGASVDWYLLEKSRVVVRAEAERSFHVFYQLLAGADRALRAQLLLDGGVGEYEYLNKSRREVDGIDDAREWAALQGAFDTVGFGAGEQLDFFRIVAAILHIGNIAITSTRADDALMPDPGQAERVCHLLGLPVAEFQRAVLRPRVLAGREWVTQARTGQQALDELAALAKTLYERSFGALVERINRALDRPAAKAHFIGVLDIAGFEIFQINGYEQLLINYTNEKLQQFFNHHMFVLEQEEYAREGIDWDYVNFGLDLQPTIDLIEGQVAPSVGVLSLLDEECIMPKATDGTFTAKLHALWSGDAGPPDARHPGTDKYEPARFAQGFLVHHYAGKVEYSTDGWLEKNKDPLNDNLTRVLAAAGDRHTKALFADAAPEGAVGAAALTFGKKRAVKKGAFRTVGQRHKEQLGSLMGTLYGTQPHFVRCIVPNALKRPGRIAAPLVLDQLRCNGVLEGIRIARLGYPNRLPFVEFRARYEVLAPGAVPRGYMDGRKAALRMVAALELDGATFKIGTSKIFFKAGVLAELEERRDALLSDIFARIQAAARRFAARRQMKKVLNRAAAIRTVQRNARVYAGLREWPWWRLYTKVRPLLAATRSDDALRRTEAELALARERAERDAREKDALDALRMRLEADRRKADEQLARERALAVDKDALLARAAARESELADELAALEADLDARDGQLDRALAIGREAEDKHRALQAAFDEAAEHLVRLEAEQREWAEREGVLAQQLGEADKELEQLEKERDALAGERAELARRVEQGGEDMARSKERMDGAVAELEAKLAAESRSRDMLKGKADAHEQDARQAREQLAELTRTAADYADMIKGRETDLARVRAELDASKGERSRLAAEAAELQGRIATLSAEVDSLRSADERHTSTQARLQAELDELRALLQAKTSEETAQREVERRTAEELVALRAQGVQLQQELDDARIAATDAQARLRVELDAATREHGALLQSHRSLSDRFAGVDARLKAAEPQLAEAEKAKRALESELQGLRTRQIDLDGQLADVSRARDALERQLAAAHAKTQDFEDTTLQLEREKNAQDRELERLKTQLEAEGARRAQAEKAAASQKAELAQLRDRTAKHERELNKTLTDLKNKEWEVKQLESRQDKTIVEHVHVLQEAKRVTDAQLAEARKELQAQDLYIKSLEKVKQRLTSEAEDLARATEQEHVQLRAKDKAVRAAEERATQAQAAAADQRRGREAAESNVRRLQADVQAARDQVAEVTAQFQAMRGAKDALEADLARIADETAPAGASVAANTATRESAARIAQLEAQLEEAHMARDTARLIREQIDRQHEEIRKLVAAPGARDDAFRDRLLRELARAEEQIDGAMRARGVPAPGVKSTVTPSKRASMNGTVRERVQSLTNASPAAAGPRKSGGGGGAEVSALKQQMQVLELKMAASDRVRQHLESALRELTADLENSDGSKASLASYRTRLARENARLGELLSDEAEARRAAQQAQLSGVQEMWSKFQAQLDAERENYARLEESRRALVVQQKNAQLEAETHKRANVELAQIKKRLTQEIADLKDRVEAETLAKKEETMSKRQALQRLQDLEVSSTSSSAMQSELREAAEAFKTKSETYRLRLEELEIEKVKVERAEGILKRAFADQEKTLSATAAERDGLAHRLKDAEIRVQELEARMEDINGESADMNVIRKRLSEEMEDERKQFEKDLADRDHAADMTRSKYQQELAQLSDELKSQRDGMSKLREELRKTRSDYDELQVRYDDETYSGGAWKKERERLETKIADLSRAYDAATGAQSEQQSQIVALHSQVRELRSVLNDAEADRSLLQKARRNLQAELETIKLDSADASRMGTDREMQNLLMQKQDLERTLEEHADRVEMATDRQRKAEAHAQESQFELGKIRVENSELDKANASLEKQVKELNLRIVDLETRSYSRAPAGASGANDATVRSLKARIDELQRELESATSARSRQSLSKDREATLRLAEADRQRMKLEEEVRAYEDKVSGMRRSMESMQATEGELQLAKRRAEREATELRQRSLNLEHEVERLRVRLDRSATPGSIGSIGSPRRGA